MRAQVEDDLMPRWTTQDLANYERRQTQSRRTRTRTFVEKLDVRHRQEGKPAVEGRGGGAFRVTITFLFSDQRTRDLDNGTATILDAVVACRRSLADSFGVAHLRPARGEGNGGGGDTD